VPVVKKDTAKKVEKKQNVPFTTATGKNDMDFE
jgi:hypothetical protein